MKTNLYNIQIITRIDEILLAGWQELWNHAENATVFNSAEWFQTCTQTDNSTAYKIIVCYKDERLVGLLPLKKSRKFGFTVVSVISSEFQVDTAFLMERYDTQLFKQLFEYLMANENLFIQKIDSHAVSQLHGLFPQLFFSLISVNPCIDLTCDYDTNISNKMLGRIKKLLKKHRGKFDFKFYENNFQKHLETMFSIDQNSWKKLHGKDIFSDKKMQYFYRVVTKLCNKFVKIGFLYYENHPIAYFYGFLYGRTFAAYHTSFLDEYRYLRPGQMALYYLINNLKDNATVIDMGGGISRYKQEFTHNYRILYDMYYAKNDLIMFWWKLINMARRLKQIVFPEKNTRDHEFLFKTLSIETTTTKTSEQLQPRLG